MAAEERSIHGAFDTLLSKNLPHVVEKIFFLLDFDSYKLCCMVSKTWNKLLTSESFQRKAKSVFSRAILEDENKLRIASSFGNIDEVRKLLSNGMLDVNCVTGCHYSTPLCAATARGHKEIVQLLMDRGADPNKGDKRGKTPLYMTALSGSKYDKYVVELLLERGAEPDKADQMGWTPLHIATRTGHMKLSKSYSVPAAESQAVLRMLLDGGADPNKRNQYGETPLHWAARNGHVEEVKILMDGGAEVNGKNKIGRTPLHDAAMCGHKDVVETLLDGGADPNEVNEEGKTPLSLARERGHTDVVNILRDSCAKCCQVL